MTESGRQDEDERPGLGEVFDWKTRRTWALFLGTYLGLGLGLGVAFIAAQVLGHKLLHLENTEIKKYLILGIALILSSAGFFAVHRLLVRVSRERKPASDASEPLNIPKAFFAHCCGTILGTVAGQILMHILQRQIDFPENQFFVMLLGVMIYTSGPGLLIFVSAIWYPPNGKIDTRAI